MMTDSTTDLTADDLTELTEGDELTVEYESVQGERGNRQTFTATVYDVDLRTTDGYLFGTIALKRDPEDLSRRRVKITAGSLTVQGRRTTMNGAVWGRLSVVRTVTVSATDADEDEDASEDRPSEDTEDADSEDAEQDGNPYMGADSETLAYIIADLCERVDRFHRASSEDDDREELKARLDAAIAAYAATEPEDSPSEDSEPRTDGGEPEDAPDTHSGDANPRSEGPGMGSRTPLTHLSLYFHLREISEGSPAERNPEGLDEQVAADALGSSDAVAFLAAAARDPYRSLDARATAHELLSRHVLPSADPLHGTRRACPLTGEPFGEWGRMAGGPGRYWWPYRCPDCGEGEVLLTWASEDAYQRGAEPAPRCHCGRSVPVPTYPGERVPEDDVARSERGARHAGPRVSDVETERERPESDGGQRALTDGGRDVERAPEVITGRGVPADPDAREGEVMVALHADGQGALIPDHHRDWIHSDADLSARMDALLTALTERADGRKLRGSRRGLFHVAVDQSDRAITRLFASSVYLKAGASPEDLTAMVQRANAAADEDADPRGEPLTDGGRDVERADATEDATEDAIPEHVLYRKRVTTDFEAQYVESNGEVMSDHAKTEALGLHMDPEVERTRTVYCTCGAAFRSEDRAVDHLADHGALDVNRYNPERWEQADERSVYAPRYDHADGEWRPRN